MAEHRWRLGDCAVDKGGRMMETRIALRRFSDRKKPCLMVEQGNCGTVLATFRNEDCAMVWMDIIGGDLVTDYDEDMFGKGEG